MTKASKQASTGKNCDTKTQMLVVATAEGTVTIYDESDGVGFQKIRKFCVMVNWGRNSLNWEEDGVWKKVWKGEPRWRCIEDQFKSPIAVVSAKGTVIAVKDTESSFSTWDLITGLFIVAS